MSLHQLSSQALRHSRGSGSAAYRSSRSFLCKSEFDSCGGEAASGCPSARRTGRGLPYLEVCYFVGEVLLDRCIVPRTNSDGYVRQISHLLRLDDAESRLASYFKMSLKPVDKPTMISTG